MSEYWKSTPKYWCKHCSTYVKDTPFERKQHESTAKHQGNLKRALRDIQNEHEKGEREKEKAKAEVDRLNRVVNGSTSSSGPSTQKISTIRKAAAGALTATDQKRQWAQLAEMGIQVPDKFKAEMAMPGQWQTVSKPGDDLASTEDPLSIGVRKRKAEGEEEDAEASEVVQQRGWGTSTKNYPEQTDADLDILLSRSIVKKENIAQPVPDAELRKLPAIKDELGPSGSDAVVKRQEFGLNKEDQLLSENERLSPDQLAIKPESAGLETTAILPNIPVDEGTPVFKKRKTKVKAIKELE